MTFVEDFVRVLDSQNERETTEENEASGDQQAYQGQDGSEGRQRDHEDQQVIEGRYGEDESSKKAPSPTDPRVSRTI